VYSALDFIITRLTRGAVNKHLLLLLYERRYEDYIRVAERVDPAYVYEIEEWLCSARKRLEED
jgi:hypothetical protein